MRAGLIARSLRTSTAPGINLSLIPIHLVINIQTKIQPRRRSETVNCAACSTKSDEVPPYIVGWMRKINCASHRGCNAWSGPGEALVVPEPWGTGNVMLYSSIIPLSSC